MLRINVIASAAQAKSYYGEQLSRGDYYAREQGQEIAGRWGGEAALRMGLSGDVTKDAFFALAEHANPVTGEPLTQRRKDNRRVGYDFTFSAPKSVSVFHARSGDDRVLNAFQESVQETMRELESEIKVRVRQDGQRGDRVTGNGLWSSFTHFTGRPVDGVADPQLHQHVILHNVTWDAAYRNRDGSRGAWMAAEVADIKANAPYYQAAMNARLAKKLADLGLTVRQSTHSFELAGFTPAMKERFSRRTGLIEARAEQLGITHAADKADLGRKTREAKRAELTMDQLRAEWHDRLTSREWRSFLSQATGGTTAPVSDTEAVDYGLNHMLERQSVATDKQVRAAALERGVGSVTPASVQAELARREEVISAEMDGQQLVSTRAVLAEEQAMLAYARAGRGVAEPLGASDVTFQSIVRDGRRFELNAGQQQAVRHVLESRSKVILVRGAAGVGKTTLMQLAVRHIEAGGRQVFTFAPTAAARDVLEKDGFHGAQTVAKLLDDQQLQQRLRGGVLWIDEAGLASTPELKRVFDVAEAQRARVVLSGDYFQNSSIRRGDAMRLLVTHAGLRPAEVTGITRQRQAEYKAAIQDLSTGERRGVVAGFDRLDRLGFIHEVSDERERYLSLAADYVDTVRDGKSALVVSPSNAEADRTTRVIRDTLKADGLIAADERTFTRLKNLHLTAAQKSNPLSYREGQVIQFHKPTKAVAFSTFQQETVLGMGADGPRPERRFEKHSRDTRLGYAPDGNVGLETRQPEKRGITYGDRLEVLGHDSDGHVQVRSPAGDVLRLPLAEGEKFSVYECSEVALAAGDKLRITQNGYTHQRSRQAAKHRLSNGGVYTVKGFTREGHVELAENGWVVGKDFSHFAHGYTSTSYSSQGKTVSHVIVAQSSESFRASNMAGFYVSASRGREAMTLYTDDKQALRNFAIQRSNQRMAASELAAGAGGPSEAPAEGERAARQRAFVARINRMAERARAYARDKAQKVRQYYQRLRQQARQQGLEYGR